MRLIGLAEGADATPPWFLADFRVRRLTVIGVGADKSENSQFSTNPKILIDNLDQFDGPVWVSVATERTRFAQR
ncbi:MAG: hypothetical protein GTO41_22125 [Burkholderiales bacterium]|nr:hypothetical protein [Burkholderiales bacterium]